MNPTATSSHLALPDLQGLGEHAPWLLLDASDHPGAISGMLAVGERRRLTLSTATADAFDQIGAFVGAASGRCVGWIGYEQLRADPMLDLPDQKPPHVALPVVHWVEPEAVLAFKGTGPQASCHWLTAPDDAALAAAMESAVAHPITAGPELHDGAHALPVSSSLHADTYRAAFEKVHRHILRGDIYELNLCRELNGALPEDFSAHSAFGALVARTLAPYSAFVTSGVVDILCASPECFLQREGGRLVSRPIKGTAARMADPQADAEAAERLRTDAKERAENVMITDLVRNDLSRVARPASVEVNELCGIHSFRNVHQMVSTVSCSVRDDVRFADILRATFPMGSMTGAPKLRAMEITAVTEPVERGLYSGTLGWAEPNGAGDAGDFHLNVVIRTAVINRAQSRWSVHVGGAITALAAADSEWAETLLKAQSVLEVLGAGTDAAPEGRTMQEKHG